MEAIIASGRRKSLTLVFVGLAVVAGLFFGYSRLRDEGFDWNLFLNAFRNLDPVWLIGAVLLVGLSYPGRALRWSIMIRPLTNDACLWRLTKATVIGFTAVVLFGRPGELVRPYLIAIRERLPFSSQMAAWFLERVYDLLVVILIFAYALTQVRIDPSQVGPALQWVLRTGGYVAGAIGAVCVVFLIVAGAMHGNVRDLVNWFLKRLPDKLSHRLGPVAHSFLSGMASARNAGFVLQLFTYTCLEWGIILAGNYMLLKALPATAHLSLLDSLVFLGFVAFGSAVQVPGVGGGMQVAAVLVLTELFGIGLEGAMGVALIYWLVVWVAVVPFGLILALAEGLNWRSLRHIGDGSTTEVVS
jgi:uncharacterized protein (TIRG00374 family)